MQLTSRGARFERENRKEAGATLPALARPLPAPASPRYLEQVYWWAYVHPNAVQLFERMVPPDDAVVQVEYQQAVVQRFENVLVERPQTIELDRLGVKLPI